MNIIVLFIQLLGMPLLILSLLASAQAADNPHPIQDKNDKNRVLIFVSFSMPKQSLIAVLHDAQKIQAPVLLQGLVENSFKATFLRMSELVQQAGGGGVSIDPTAFEHYRITQVPTVVVLGDTEPCIDKMVGDIPLSAALKNLQNHGNCSSPEIPLLLQRLEKGNTHA